MQVEVCNDSFEKNCQIEYSARLMNINVEVCRNIPQRNCSDNIIGCDSFAHEIGL